MDTLTTEQQRQLVEIITEEHGNALPFDGFADALLDLLENVPGFETATQHCIAELTQLLWSQYHV